MDIRAIFLVFCIVVNSVKSVDDLLVNTEVGAIRGVRSEDGQYNMYMGIPYAKVNESNPFGASVPTPYFDEIFEANDDSSMCPQIEEFNFTIAGDLDCLRLNIYTPLNITSNSRLPVFVWIYGGGFTIGFFGRHMYGPKFLVRDDIIVVTLNYRVGPYGFMCLDIPEVPGNQGLKDQIAALRWIKSHISSFGGDPDHITIGGSSAGGVSVDFHLHRDNSDETLFEKVVMHSGTSLATAYSIPLKDAPIILASYFNFSTNNIYEAIEFLAHVPPRDLILAESSLEISIGSVCIEKTFEGVESYLSSNWVANPKLPAASNMSVLIGINDDELGNMRAMFGGTRRLNDVLGGIFNSQHQDFPEMAELANQFYLGDENIGPSTVDGFIDFASDISFVHSTYRTVYKYLENEFGNIYLYNFSHVGSRNFVRRRINIDVGGAYHADEISYIFDMAFMPEEPTADDKLVIDKMTRMWTNFVKYSDPTPEITELIDVKWEPVGRNTPMYSMNINTQLSLATNPIADRVTFWDVFYEQNGHFQLLLLMS